MVDNFLKTGTKDENGIAKPLRSDSKGNLKVTQKSTVVPLTEEFTTNKILENNGNPLYIMGSSEDTTNGFVDVSDFNSLKINLTIYNPLAQHDVQVDYHMGRGTQFKREIFKTNAELSLHTTLSVPVKSNFMRISLVNKAKENRELMSASVLGSTSPTASEDLFDKTNGVFDINQKSVIKDLTTPLDVNVVLEVGEKHFVLGSESELAEDFVNVSDFTKLNLITLTFDSLGEYEIIVDYHTKRRTHYYTRTFTSRTGNRYAFTEIPVLTELVRISIRNIGSNRSTLMNVILSGVTGSSGGSSSQVGGLSTVKDDEGEPVLRVVDSAPHAYDIVNDLLKVSGEMTISKDLTDKHEFITKENDLRLTDEEPSTEVLFDFYANESTGVTFALAFYNDVHKNNVDVTFSYGDDNNISRPLTIFSADFVAIEQENPFVEFNQENVVLSKKLIPYGRYAKLKITKKEGFSEVHLHRLLVTNYLK